jgi:hypothetical protein
MMILDFNLARSETNRAAGALDVYREVGVLALGTDPYALVVLSAEIEDRGDSGYDPLRSAAVATDLGDGTSPVSFSSAVCQQLMAHSWRWCLCRSRNPGRYSQDRRE